MSFEDMNIRKTLRSDAGVSRNRSLLYILVLILFPEYANCGRLKLTIYNGDISLCSHSMLYLSTQNQY
jgi:hypothetical protein